MEALLSNPYVTAPLKLALFVYGGAFAPKLPPKVVQFINQPVPQAILLAAILYINFGIRSWKYIIIAVAILYAAIQAFKYLYPSAEGFSVFGFDPMSEAQQWFQMNGADFFKAVDAANGHAQVAIAEIQNGNANGAIAAAEQANFAAQNAANTANNMAAANGAFANTAQVANSMANSANQAVQAIANGNHAAAANALNGVANTAEMIAK